MFGSFFFSNIKDWFYLGFYLLVCFICLMWRSHNIKEILWCLFYKIKYKTINLEQLSVKGIKLKLKQIRELKVTRKSR
jgi:hypothetical protein